VSLRYADFLFAQALQSAACNAGHSNEQRAARCILSVRQRTGDVVPLTHEQLASMLGIAPRGFTEVFTKAGAGVR
jgi:CRP-like cAMP-binding protein